MWLTTSKDNRAAMALYRRAGGTIPRGGRVVQWTFQAGSMR